MKGAASATNDASPTPTIIRNISIEKKPNERPHPETERDHTINPIAINRNGAFFLEASANSGAAINIPTINDAGNRPTWNRLSPKLTRIPSAFIPLLAIAPLSI